MKKIKSLFTTLIALIATPVYAVNTVKYEGQTVKDIINNIIGWVLGFAGAIAVLFIIYAGILYITASGNKDRQEQAKKTLTYAVIGLVVVILSYFIVGFIEGNLPRIF